MDRRGRTMTRILSELTSWPRFGFGLGAWGSLSRDEASSVTASRRAVAVYKVKSIT